MKTILVLGLVALLMITPGVAADDDDTPVCGDMGAKGCALGLVDEVLGPCNPLYNYFKECDPTS